jgi:hypothetical protein
MTVPFGIAWMAGGYALWSHNDATEQIARE